MSKLYDRLQQIAKGEIDGESSASLVVFQDGSGRVEFSTVWGRKETIIEFYDLSDLLLKLAKLSIKEKYENTQIV